MQLGQDDLNDAALSNALNNMARKVYDAGDFDIDMMAEAEAMEMTGATFESVMPWKTMLLFFPDLRLITCFVKSGFRLPMMLVI